jgi:starch synthase (maltosyl-transferring)
LRNLDIHWSDDASISCSKYLDGKFYPPDVVTLIIVGLTSIRSAPASISDPPGSGQPTSRSEVTDLITRQKFTWGQQNFVSLDVSSSLSTSCVELLRGA